MKDRQDFSRAAAWNEGASGPGGSGFAAGTGGTAGPAVPVGTALPEWLGRRAALNPDGLALIAADRRWTFRELDEGAAATARLLLAALAAGESAATEGWAATGASAAAGDSVAAGGSTATQWAAAGRGSGPTSESAPGGRHGIPPRVAVLMGNTPQYVMAVHAAAKAGAVLVPLNVRLTPGELGWQLYDAGAALLLYDDERAAAAEAAVVEAAVVAAREEGAGGETGRDPFLVRAVNVAEARSFIGGGSGGLRDRIELDALHSIVYTSGTTGKPKGALLTAGNFWWNVTGSALHLGVRSDDVWLACMPLFHVGGLSILLRSVISGMAVLLHEQFDPAAVNEAIDRHGITLLSVVAVMLERMLAERGDAVYPEHLRAVLVGGGPAPDPLLARAAALGLPALQTYGLTEAASQVATQMPGDPAAKPGSAGKPLFPVQLRIVAARPDFPADGEPRAEAVGDPSSEAQADPVSDRQTDSTSLQALPPGEIGEIVVAGPTVSPGYWRREPQQTPLRGPAQTSLRGPWQTPLRAPGDWFRTGDLGYVDEEGYLYVVDRREDLIVSGGENVYPAEVESILREHPAVAEAGVVGVADDRWSRVPAAAVVLRTGAEADEAELLGYCRRRLAGYKVPIRIMFVAELPRNASGKLLRRRLRETLAQSGP